MARCLIIVGYRLAAALARNFVPFNLIYSTYSVIMTHPSGASDINILERTLAIMANLNTVPREFKWDFHCLLDLSY